MRKMAALVLLFMLCFGIHAGAVSETDSGIIYSVENREVTVEGFNYVGTTMDIPAEIDGMPVRYIAPQACRTNNSIVDLTIPASVVSVGEFAFADCKSLVSVTFEGETEIIGFSAFMGCEALKSVTLADGLKSIDDCAFYGCTMLRKLTVPASLTTIGVDVFNGCSALTLDVSKNAVAREYAERYSIPTDFRSSWGFTVVMTVVAAVVFGVAVLVFDRAVLKKHMRKKRTE